MPYNKTNWENLPSTNTALDAEHLQKIENELEKLGGLNVTTSADLDNYISEGVYAFLTTGASPTNAPESGTYGWLIVLSSSNSNFAKQIWVRSASISGTNEFKVFIRHYTNNTWSSWKKFSIEKPSIEAGLTSNQTLSTTNNTILPLTSIYNLGSGFTVNNDGGVVVGAGVTYIKISGMVTFSNVSTADGRYYAVITKNGTTSTQADARARLATNSSYQSIAIAPRITAVAEGDVLYLCARSQDGTGSVVYGSDTRTYMTIEAIA